MHQREPNTFPIECDNCGKIGEVLCKENINPFPEGIPTDLEVVLISATNDFKIIESKQVECTCGKVFLNFRR